MPRRRSYTTEQIITKLREAEISLSQGKTVKEASKQLEISEQTYYCWLRNIVQKHGLKIVANSKYVQGIEVACPEVVTPAWSNG